MSSTINKGLDKAKEGVTNTGDGIKKASDHVGDKLTGAKDCVKDKSSEAYNKTADGVKHAGEYIGDKCDAAKKAVHDKTSK